MRSTSRMPTERPCRERASASWRVTDDLPTPPFPERICVREWMLDMGGVKGVKCLSASSHVCYR